MEFKDYYKTLGVQKTASEADIKRAYRKLARAHHPDLNPNDKTAEARFKEINEAYEVLGNADSRRKYDELGANWRQYEQAQREGGVPPGWGPMGGGGATYRTMTPEEMAEVFGTEDPFSDFFHTFFGGASAGARRTGGRPRRGGGGVRVGRGVDVDQPIELTLEEVLTGTSRRLAITRGGQRRTIDVRIPAGVRDGARVRAAGEGGEGSGGGSAGDLYLVVSIAPHPRFERRGQDLHTRVRVPVTTGVLGGETEVTSLSGSTLRLKIPELTTAGRVLRLKGHGLPAVGRPDDRGDLYVTVDVELPSRLSDEERRHWEALRNLK
jgi:DnaJ-class molecular chaperone